MIDTGWCYVIVSRRDQADAGVIMLVVVPGKEATAKTQTIVVAAEAIGKLGSVLHGLELAFRKGIVVGNMRPAMRFGDA
jgi:hypothetical protein